MSFCSELGSIRMCGAAVLVLPRAAGEADRNGGARQQKDGVPAQFPDPSPFSDMEAIS